MMLSIEIVILFLILLHYSLAKKVSPSNSPSSGLKIGGINSKSILQQLLLFLLILLLLLPLLLLFFLLLLLITTIIISLLLLLFLLLLLLLRLTIINYN